MQFSTPDRWFGGIATPDKWLGGAMGAATGLSRLNPFGPSQQPSTSKGIAQQQQPLQAQAQQNAQQAATQPFFDRAATPSPAVAANTNWLTGTPNFSFGGNDLSPGKNLPAPTSYSDAPPWDGRPDAMSTAYRSPVEGLPGGSGIPGGGGVSMPFFRAPTYAGYPTLHDQGQALGAGLNNWLVGSYLNGPSAMVNQLNSAWDEQSYRNQQAQLYNNQLEAKYGTANRLIDMLGASMGGGGAAPGSGFRQFDIAGNPTGLYADSSGNTGTNVTAQALQPEQIASATSAMNTPANQVAPTSVAGIQVGGDAGNAVADAIQSNDAAQGSQNALAFDRSMTPANSDLAYGIQGERANQGVDLSRWLLGLQSLNNQSTLFNQNLLGSVFGSIA